MAKQDNSVQTLRGFAIILVVMGHVINYFVISKFIQ